MYIWTPTALYNQNGKLTHINETTDLGNLKGVCLFYCSKIVKLFGDLGPRFESFQH